MNCINLKIRTKNYEKYIYCLKRKQRITYRDCENCRYKEYKKFKELKKQSKKQKKLESKRFSMLTDNLEICYMCDKRRKEDLHEIFPGSNRKKSMQWGMVIPICRICHNEWDINEELRKTIQIKAQDIFEKEYSHKLFMAEFKIDYKEKWRGKDEIRKR